MSWRCKDCGNTDEFYGFGATTVIVFFDQYDNVTGVSEPELKNLGAEVECCGICDSENITEDEEEEE